MRPFRAQRGVVAMPLAFFEVVMHRAFVRLGDDRTEVSVETGLRAAEKLQSVLDGRQRGTDVLELKVAWAAIIEKLEELERHAEALDVGTDSFDDDHDDHFDPIKFIDECDEF